MNFGWLNNNTSEKEYNAVVLHEFGHALGFEHELQMACYEIPWDVEKVIEYYKETQNWTEDDVKQ
jgi:hypothetical protein